MAQGILQSLDQKLEVFSAGTKPAEKVNPRAVKVMNEIGIDISGHVPIMLPIIRMNPGIM